MAESFSTCCKIEFGSGFYLTRSLNRGILYLYRLNLFPFPLKSAFPPSPMFVRFHRPEFLARVESVFGHYKKEKSMEDFSIHFHSELDYHCMLQKGVTRLLYK